MTNERKILILKGIQKNYIFGTDPWDVLDMEIKALSQEPCDKCRNNHTSICGNCKEYDEYELCDDAIGRDFQIGDEVRIIGSDPIYDDCDVGWVIRNASEKVKTMYVMRNDGSAEEEAKAEWYKTGRHNAMLAEVIKALPSVRPSRKGHQEFLQTHSVECSKYL